MQAYSKSYYSIEPLPESSLTALARIDGEGHVITINSAGSALWGWEVGFSIPDHLLGLLVHERSISSFEDRAGREFQVTCVTQGDGWLLIGQINTHQNESAKKSSIKTLIENPIAEGQGVGYHLTHGVLFLDRAGHVLFGNEQLKSLLQLSNSPGFLGSSLRELGFDAGLIDNTFRLLSRESNSFQYALASPLVGEEGLLNVYGTPILDSSNNLLGAFLSFEPRHILPGGQSLMQGEVRSGDQMALLKNVFVTMMSHEIRTPLGVMNGYAEILGQELEEYENKSETELPAQIKEFVNAIHENTQRILGLVNELFDLSNMRQLTISPIDLHTTLQPVIENIASQLEKTGVEFIVDLEANEPLVLSNPNRLSQIMHNLLSNAVKFTHQGSITLRTRANGDFVVVEIIDTGIGISQSYQEELFTPFLQEDMGVNRKFEGAGLGLALVKLLLDLMRGQIEVESKKGEGSTFRVLLPSAA